MAKRTRMKKQKNPPRRTKARKRRQMILQRLVGLLRLLRRPRVVLFLRNLISQRLRPLRRRMRSRLLQLASGK
jgi:hypothetical protein